MTGRRSNANVEEVYPLATKKNVKITTGMESIQIEISAISKVKILKKRKQALLLLNLLRKSYGIKILSIREKLRSLTSQTVPSD